MTVVIRAAALIDGVSAEPVALAEVQIESSGRIVYAGSRADAPVVDHADKVYDLPGLTLLPGLIDSHVHQTDVAASSGEANDVKVTLRALYPLRTMLHSGITSARNPGAPGITSMELREAQASGQIEGPRMLVAGRILCPTGGHGYSSGLEADGPEGVRKATRILFKQGANFIKVTASGGGLTPSTHMGQPTFTTDELRAAVEEAAQHDSYVTAHCHSSAAMERALDAGIRMLEHGSFFNSKAECEFIPDLADRLAETGTVICPTIAVNARWVEEYAGREHEVPDADRARYTLTRERWKRRLDVVGELYARGVPLIVGSDAPSRNVPFDDFPYSIALHARAGIPTMEAIRQATSLAAKHIGLGAITGSLSAGLAADLIAVSGDPSTDLSTLERVRFVMQQGEVRRHDLAPAEERHR